ncbi:MAG: inorganic phosphate transporter, partial [Bacteroidales bacterium]|nr:inorganic phosphate transporter [Bacteroidales bacterium]
METLFIVMIVILFLLAISDLIVGVSNDAVNFLVSAIGSKAASWGVIMLIASLGVLFGATFSSGMMEVARKGIFNPQMFAFNEIMIIFLAVMFTDIILLDTFNTLGLPTSTTVSIVFELLGAAIAVSLIKLGFDENSEHNLSDYINSAKALAIILGILLSVVVAFSVGMVIQFISRLIFSFKYQKTLKLYGSVWGGIAITAITYFILIKGAKGASFMHPETVIWIKTHTLVILGSAFLGWAIVLQVLNSFFKINVLKVIVLFGTFALAMAFA